MPLVAIALILFAILATIALLPLSILQRYRMGTSRQQARGCLIALNLFALTASTVMFLIGAAFTNIWVPNAFAYTLAGLFGGSALGFIGLALTRWEITPRSVHYTPNRLLVLAITMIVAARLLYGLVRTWQGWQDSTDWVAASGAAGALGAGAVVLGYYLTYWIGVKRRLRRLR